MKSSIITIGQDEGIILPPELLQQLHLSSASSVEIEVENGKIIIKPELRHGWAEAAKRMNANGDDKLLLKDELNDFEKNEWTW
ncbi:MAG: AbrB/MazE/SpoVT family DNA-binding domain-containing protein [Sphingobacteriaceae bacterium]|nr:MAG: AbrB/MazE/SpoVT family DNA-binding domain-containing protein [Sphingobacteriaceae bacterium]